MINTLLALLFGRVLTEAEHNDMQRANFQKQIRQAKQKQEDLRDHRDRVHHHINQHMGEMDRCMQTMIDLQDEIGEANKSQREGEHFLKLIEERMITPPKGATFFDA